MPRIASKLPIKTFGEEVARILRGSGWTAELRNFNPNSKFDPKIVAAAPDGREFRIELGPVEDKATGIEYLDYVMVFFFGSTKAPSMFCRPAVEPLETCELIVQWLSEMDDAIERLQETQFRGAIPSLGPRGIWSFGFMATDRDREETRLMFTIDPDHARVVPSPSLARMVPGTIAGTLQDVTRFMAHVHDGGIEHDREEGNITSFPEDPGAWPQRVAEDRSLPKVTKERPIPHVVEVLKRNGWKAGMVDGDDLAIVSSMDNNTVMTLEHGRRITAKCVGRIGDGTLTHSTNFTPEGFLDALSTFLDELPIAQRLADSINTRSQWDKRRHWDLVCHDGDWAVSRCQIADVDLYTHWARLALPDTVEVVGIGGNTVFTGTPEEIKAWVAGGRGRIDEGAGTVSRSLMIGIPMLLGGGWTRVEGTSRSTVMAPDGMTSVTVTDEYCIVRVSRDGDTWGAEVDNIGTIETPIDAAEQVAIAAERASVAVDAVREVARLLDAQVLSPLSQTFMVGEGRSWPWGCAICFKLKLKSGRRLFLAVGGDHHIEANLGGGWRGGNLACSTPAAMAVHVGELEAADDERVRKVYGDAADLYEAERPISGWLATLNGIAEALSSHGWNADVSYDKVYASFFSDSTTDEIDLQVDQHCIVMQHDGADLVSEGRLQSVDETLERISFLLDASREARDVAVSLHRSGRKALLTHVGGTSWRLKVPVMERGMCVLTFDTATDEASVDLVKGKELERIHTGTVDSARAFIMFPGKYVSEGRKRSSTGQSSRVIDGLISSGFKRMANDWFVHDYGKTDEIRIRLFGPIEWNKAPHVRWQVRIRSTGCDVAVPVGDPPDAIMERISSAIGDMDSGRLAAAAAALGDRTMVDDDGVTQHYLTPAGYFFSTFVLGRMVWVLGNVGLTKFEPINRSELPADIMDALELKVSSLGATMLPPRIAVYDGMEEDGEPLNEASGKLLRKGHQKIGVIDAMAGSGWRRIDVTGGRTVMLSPDGKHSVSYVGVQAWTGGNRFVVWRASDSDVSISIYEPTEHTEESALESISVAIDDLPRVARLGDLIDNEGVTRQGGIYRFWARLGDAYVLIVSPDLVTGTIMDGNRKPVDAIIAELAKRGLTVQPTNYARPLNEEGNPRKGSQRSGAAIAVLRRSGWTSVDKKGTWLLSPDGKFCVRYSGIYDGWLDDADRKFFVWKVCKAGAPKRWDDASTIVLQEPLDGDPMQTLENIFKVLNDFPRIEVIRSSLVSRNTDQVWHSDGAYGFWSRGKDQCRVWTRDLKTLNVAAWNGDRDRAVSELTRESAAVGCVVLSGLNEGEIGEGTERISSRAATIAAVRSSIEANGLRDTSKYPSTLRFALPDGDVLVGRMDEHYWAWTTAGVEGSMVSDTSPEGILEDLSTFLAEREMAREFAASVGCRDHSLVRSNGRWSIQFGLGNVDSDWVTVDFSVPDDRCRIEILFGSRDREPVFEGTMADAAAFVARARKEGLPDAAILEDRGDARAAGVAAAIDAIARESGYETQVGSDWIKVRLDDRKTVGMTYGRTAPRINATFGPAIFSKRTEVGDPAEVLEEMLDWSVECQSMMDAVEPLATSVADPRMWLDQGKVDGKQTWFVIPSTISRAMQAELGWQGGSAMRMIWSDLEHVEVQDLFDNELFTGPMPEAIDFVRQWHRDRVGKVYDPLSEAARPTHELAMLGGIEQIARENGFEDRMVESDSPVDRRDPGPLAQVAAVLRSSGWRVIFGGPTPWGSSNVLVARTGDAQVVLEVDPGVSIRIEATNGMSTLRAGGVNLKDPVPAVDIASISIRGPEEIVEFLSWFLDEREAARRAFGELTGTVPSTITLADLPEIEWAAYYVGHGRDGTAQYPAVYLDRALASPELHTSSRDSINDPVRIRGLFSRFDSVVTNGERSERKFVAESGAFVSPILAGVRDIMVDSGWEIDKFVTDPGIPGERSRFATMEAGLPGSDVKCRMVEQMGGTAVSISVKLDPRSMGGWISVGVTPRDPLLVIERVSAVLETAKKAVRVARLIWPQRLRANDGDVERSIRFAGDRWEIRYGYDYWAYATWEAGTTGPVTMVALDPETGRDSSSSKPLSTAGALRWLEERFRWNQRRHREMMNVREGQDDAAAQATRDEKYGEIVAIMQASGWEIDLTTVVTMSNGIVKVAFPDAWKTYIHSKRWLKAYVYRRTVHTAVTVVVPIDADPLTLLSAISEAIDAQPKADAVCSEVSAVRDGATATATLDPDGWRIETYDEGNHRVFRTSDWEAFVPEGGSAVLTREQMVDFAVGRIDEAASPKLPTGSVGDLLAANGWKSTEASKYGSWTSPDSRVSVSRTIPAGVESRVEYWMVEDQSTQVSAVVPRGNPEDVLDSLMDAIDGLQRLDEINSMVSVYMPSRDHDGTWRFAVPGSSRSMYKIVSPDLETFYQEGRSKPMDLRGLSIRYGVNRPKGIEKRTDEMVEATLNRRALRSKNIVRDGVFDLFTGNGWTRKGVRLSAPDGASLLYVTENVWRFTRGDSSVMICVPRGIDRDSVLDRIMDTIDRFDEATAAAKTTSRNRYSYDLSREVDGSWEFDANIAKKWCVVSANSDLTEFSAVGQDRTVIHGPVSLPELVEFLEGYGRIDESSIPGPTSDEMVEAMLRKNGWRRGQVSASPGNYAWISPDRKVVAERVGTYIQPDGYSVWLVDRFDPRHPTLDVIHVESSKKTPPEEILHRLGTAIDMIGDPVLALSVRIPRLRDDEWIMVFENDGLNPGGDYSSVTKDLRSFRLLTLDGEEVIDRAEVFRRFGDQNAYQSGDAPLSEAASRARVNAPKSVLMALEGSGWKLKSSVGRPAAVSPDGTLTVRYDGLQTSITSEGRRLHGWRLIDVVGTGRKKEKRNVYFECSPDADRDSQLDAISDCIEMFPKAIAVYNRLNPMTHAFFRRNMAGEWIMDTGLSRGWCMVMASPDLETFSAVRYTGTQRSKPLPEEIIHGPTDLSSLINFLIDYKGSPHRRQDPLRIEEARAPKPSVDNVQGVIWLFVDNGWMCEPDSSGFKLQSTDGSGIAIERDEDHWWISGPWEPRILTIMTDAVPTEDPVATASRLIDMVKASERLLSMAETLDKKGMRISSDAVLRGDGTWAFSISPNRGGAWVDVKSADLRTFVPQKADVPMGLRSLLTHLKETFGSLLEGKEYSPTGLEVKKIRMRLALECLKQNGWETRKNAFGETTIANGDSDVTATTSGVDMIEIEMGQRLTIQCYMSWVTGEPEDLAEAIAMRCEQVERMMPNVCSVLDGIEAVRGHGETYHYSRIGPDGVLGISIGHTGAIVMFDPKKPDVGFLCMNSAATVRPELRVEIPIDYSGVGFAEEFERLMDEERALREEREDRPRHDVASAAFELVTGGWKPTELYGDTFKMRASPSGNFVCSISSKFVTLWNRDDTITGSFGVMDDSDLHDAADSIAAAFEEFDTLLGLWDPLRHRAYRSRTTMGRNPAGRWRINFKIAPAIDGAVMMYPGDPDDVMFVVNGQAKAAHTVDDVIRFVKSFDDDQTNTVRAMLGESDEEARPASDTWTSMLSAGEILRRNGWVVSKPIAHELGCLSPDGIVSVTMVQETENHFEAPRAFLQMDTDTAGSGMWCPLSSDTSPDGILERMSDVLENFTPVARCVHRTGLEDVRWGDPEDHHPEELVTATIVFPTRNVNAMRSRRRPAIVVKKREQEVIVHRGAGPLAAGVENVRAWIMAKEDPEDRMGVAEAMDPGNRMAILRSTVYEAFRLLSSSEGIVGNPKLPESNYLVECRFKLADNTSFIARLDEHTEDPIIRITLGGVEWRQLIRFPVSVTEHPTEIAERIIDTAVAARSGHSLMKSIAPTGRTLELMPDGYVWNSSLSAGPWLFSWVLSATGGVACSVGWPLKDQSTVWVFDERNDLIGEFSQSKAKGIVADLVDYANTRGLTEARVMIDPATIVWREMRAMLETNGWAIDDGGQFHESEFLVAKKDGVSIDLEGSSKGIAVEVIRPLESHGGSLIMRTEAHDSSIAALSVGDSTDHAVNVLGFAMSIAKDVAQFGAWLDASDAHFNKQLHMKRNYYPSVGFRIVGKDRQTIQVKLELHGDSVRLRSAKTVVMLGSPDQLIPELRKLKERPYRGHVDLGRDNPIIDESEHSETRRLAMLGQVAQIVRANAEDVARISQNARGTVIVDFDGGGEMIIGSSTVVGTTRVELFVGDCSVSAYVHAGDSFDDQIEKTAGMALMIASASGKVIPMFSPFIKEINLGLNSAVEITVKPFMDEGGPAFTLSNHSQGWTVQMDADSGEWGLMTNGNDVIKGIGHDDMVRVFNGLLGSFGMSGAAELRVAAGRIVRSVRAKVAEAIEGMRPFTQHSAIFRSIGWTVIRQGDNRIHTESDGFGITLTKSDGDIDVELEVPKKDPADSRLFCRERNAFSMGDDPEDVVQRCLDALNLFANGSALIDRMEDMLLDGPGGDAGINAPDRIDVDVKHMALVHWMSIERAGAYYTLHVTLRADGRIEFTAPGGLTKTFTDQESVLAELKTWIDWDGEVPED